MSYETEAALEELLVTQLAHIPNVPEGSRAVRQLSTPMGPADVCVIAPSGRLTIVECKLEKTSEHRRRVVGQVVEYAAAVHQMGPENFLSAWRAKGGTDYDEFLEAGGLEALESSIRQGSIDMSIVVDQIDDDLRRLIEYLNLVTRDDVAVTALELAYVKHEGFEVMIPTPFGFETAQAKPGVRAREKQPWTWESFIDELVDAGDREFAQDLYRRAHETPQIGQFGQLWMGSRPKGSIYFQPTGQKYGPFLLWQNSAHRLQVFGTWRTWSHLRNDPRYEEVARALGQSHLGGASGTDPADIEIDSFWEAVLSCDQALNS